MPDGGTLSIKSSLNANKGVVEIEIADAGSGISQEDLPNIFEPFYSTKTEGSGLGLRLSTVYGIIDRHKGSITLDSEVGKGTVFSIKLPMGK
jgi:signal transduction histidine kinase